jgi:hypothetical protein
VNTADIIAKAADIVEANGFCRNYLYDTRQAAGGTNLKNCRVDIIGAINIALHETPRYTGSAQGVEAEKELASRVDAPSIVAWCSHRNTGKEQAVKLLRDTAAELRAAVAA